VTPALGIKIVAEVARGWTRKAEPQPAVGDQSSAGTDQPSAGTDQSSAGTDQPSAGTDQQPATGDRFMRKVAALRMAEEEEGVEPVGDEDVSWLDDNVEVIIGDRVLSDAADVPSGAAQVPSDAGDVAPAASLVPPTTTTTTTTTIAGPVSGAATIQVVDEGDDAERDLLDRLRSDVTDTSALAELATVRRLRGRRGAVWAAEAVLSAFDPSVRPQQAPAAAPQPAEDVLARFGPWEADVLHRAAGMIWNSAASAFAEGLSARGVRPADQVSPLGGTDLSRAVAAFSETLLFFRFQVYRRSGVHGFDIVRTVPPSVLFPGETDEAVGPTLVAAGIAACVSPHVLPMSLSASDRDAFLHGLLAAFGPPDRMDKLSPRAAAVAQDLWHFVPPRGQIALREALAAATAPP
ncbi:MAG: hypothetical protein QME96_18360, partial [Myxococcota bacterium]|nr:hypothetical protein [Myxococcota bacterium]